jgi:lactate dehydrogenase-like 2-hydroxyacid dehydrogenase
MFSMTSQNSGTVPKQIEARIVPEFKELHVSLAADSLQPAHRLLQFDTKRIAKMKRRSTRQCWSRCNTDALLEALQQKCIRAAIDVVDPEPLPPEHPLWSALNLLFTPHIASDSSRTMQRALRLSSERAQRFARNQPLQNVVVGEY